MIKNLSDKLRRIQLFILLQIINIVLAISVITSIWAIYGLIVQTVLLPIAAILYLYLIYQIVTDKDNRYYYLSFMIIGVLCAITAYLSINKYADLSNTEISKVANLELTLIAMFGTIFVFILTPIESFFSQS